jgi:predicted nucleotidyltransferase
MNELAKNFAAVAEAAQLPGDLMFGRLTGSRCYGTHGSESDWDWAGVYVTPTRRLLGLEVPPDVKSRSKGAGDAWSDPARDDYSFQEVGKFLKVALGGNANAIECLFADMTTREDSFAESFGHPFAMPCFWDELRSHRTLFLSRHVVGHYLSYATSQLKRIAQPPERPEDAWTAASKWKDVSHGVRLLHEAKRIAQGQPPLVNLANDPPLLKFVRSVRFGECTRSDVLYLCARTTADIEAMAPWPLPDEGPKELANDWLVRLRMYAMNSGV